MSPTPFHESVADVNGDEAIDILDALMVARYDAGLIGEFWRNLLVLLLSPIIRISIDVYVLEYQMWPMVKENL